MDIDIQQIIIAAKAGGKEIAKYFGEVLELEEKSMASDFRTKADTEAEKAILTVLQEAFPDFNIYSEEVGKIDKKSDYTFVIDPLDGSNNFALGIPTFCVSIGLLKRNEIIAGVIHHPILNHTYFAEKGKGAWLEDSRRKVNKESNMMSSTIAYTYGYSASRELQESLIHELNKKRVKRFLQNWCPTYELCLLAAGKIEGIINNDNELYDYCAGKLIAKEAGAKVTDFDGNLEVNDKSNIFIISNGTKIHQELLSLIK